MKYINKKLKYSYEVLETIEAGMVLLGPEVKSLRNTSVSFGDSFACIKNEEVWLINLHIPQYKLNTIINIDPTRKRKLLLHKSQIRKLEEQIKKNIGLTLIPSSIYQTKKYIKCELALCRGKKKYDKRESLKEKDFKRESNKYL